MRHGSLVLAASLITNVFNYVFHFIVSRKLGLSGYGALSAVIATLTISAIPAGIMATVLAKYAAEYHALGDLARLHALARRSTLVLAVVAFIATLVVLATSQSIARYLQIDEPRVMTLLAVIFGMNLLLPALRGVLQGTHDFAGFAWSTALEASGKALLGSAFAWLGYGLTGAIGGYAIGVAISLTFTLVTLRPHFGGPARALDIDITRFVSTAGGIAASITFLTTLAFADVMLVKHFFAPEIAGLYGVVSLIGKIILFVLSFVPTVILPKVTSRAIRGLSPRMLLLEAGAIMLVIAGVGLSIVYFSPERLIAIVAGQAFVPASYYLFPYAVAMALLAVSGAAAAYKTGLHRYGFLMFLGIAMVGEIVAIHLWHDSLERVLFIVLAGHLFACLGSLYRIDAPVIAARRLAPAMEAA